MKRDVAEIIPPKKIFVGNPLAELVLTEFGEYENVECAKANEIVKKLLREFDGDIRFNFRHFPLIKFHQRSHKASEAAVAAAQEGKFWEMHNILFENMHQLGTVSLKEYAKKAGVTDKNFLTKMVDAYYGWTVRADLIEGLNKGLTAIPAFYINDKAISGLPTLKNLSAQIAKSLLENKKKPDRAKLKI